ncbi:MAG TPA: DUF4126 domain-containing protein [Blastocatellia bacterium]|nr:DUF4126 domain-containing protein [Blastocatellia bacterium]
MDWTTLGVAMGSAWLSGINLYATVVTLGLLQKFSFVKLPGELSILSSGWVLGVAGAMYVVEFFADKIPAVDSAWDAVHTFIRVPAGAILAATAFADFDPTVKTIAMIVGGGVALGSHGLKATTRLAANTSPEPVSNIALSVGEDIFTIGSAILMAISPVAILVMVVLFIILLIWLIPKIYRTLRWLMRKFRSLFGRVPEEKPVGG